MAAKILVVDDDPNVQRLLQYTLKQEGYEVVLASDGAEGFRLWGAEAPDLILLDVMLPKLNGFEVLRELRRLRLDTPVIMLTAKAEEIDRVVGLELGADDYVTKPFSPRELVLRVKKILERATGTAAPAEVLKAGDITMDTAKHSVAVKGLPVELTATEFKLLATLMERRSRVQTRDTLLTDVWGYEGDVDTRTVDTHVRRLREKLGRAADAIETVRGVGYRLAE